MNNYDEYEGGSEAGDMTAMVCDCGRHKGSGELTPENRAARYERMRITQSCFDEFKASWLADYKKVHGHVRPEDFMQLVGNKIQDFMTDNRNASKVAGPDYIFGTYQQPIDKWKRLQNLADQQDIGKCLDGVWKLGFDDHNQFLKYNAIMHHS